MASWTLAARWIFPVDRPPLEHAGITIEGDRIVDITPEPPSGAIDLGEVAILPGMVNGHTHLDLSGLHEKVPPRADFPSWLREIIEHRRRQSPEQVEADIRNGLEDSIAEGVTLLCDIAGQGLSWPVLRSAPIRSLVCYEVIGLGEDRARSALASFQQWLSHCDAASHCKPGVSPHAPYTVRNSLYLDLAKLAARGELLVATHLAETKTELELLESGEGPLRDFLVEVGAWDANGLIGSVTDVISHFGSAPNLLLAHGNYLTEEQAVLAKEATIVYCPRTHAAFGHSRYPLSVFLKQGNRVILGTDSLASSPDLSILEEARYMHRQFREISGSDLLRMITLSGAEALGWGDVAGSLAPGKSADLVVLPAPEEPENDAHEVLFDSSTKPWAALCRGEWIYGKQRALGN